MRTGCRWRVYRPMHTSMTRRNSIASNKRGQSIEKETRFTVFTDWCYVLDCGILPLVKHENYR